MYHDIKGKVRAPDFRAGLTWFNTERPLSLRELRGKIVLLDFWTYCCINCMHVLPDLKKLERKYPDALVVIGVHSPKFENERVDENVRQAILRYTIEHPVVCDPLLSHWQQFAIRAWPTLALIDPEGYAVGLIPGEGNYEALDEIIGEMITEYREKGLLNETPLDWKRESMPSSPLLFPGKILAPAESDELIISDTNHHRILIANEEGKILETIGSGERGSEDDGFETCRFAHPQGVCALGSTLFVADTENHLIRAIHRKDRKVSTVAGTGEQARFFNQAGFGTHVALNSPWDLTYLDPYLYIAMAGFHQIWAYHLYTGELTPFAGSGAEARVDGPRSSSALAQPSGICSDGKFLYVADSETSSIRKISIEEDRVETLVGEDLFEFGDRDGPAKRVRLQHPLGISIFNNFLYIADSYNNKIKQIDSISGETETLSGTRESGRMTGLKPRFFEPGGLSVRREKIFVADTNNHRIMVLNLHTGEGNELPLKF